MILPNRDILWTVEPEYSGLRLDRYLMKRLDRFSRATLQSYVRDGLIEIRSVPPGFTLPREVRVSTPVTGGMEILLRRSQQEAEPLETQVPRAPLHILYEDPDLIVVDKPAGMLVHPSGFRVHGTVIMELRRRYGDKEFLSLGHRLDRDTSGVLVITRGLENDRRLKAAFKGRGIRKGYLAVVHGEPPWEEQSADAPMGDNVDGEVRVRQVIRADGAEALTHFRVLRRLRGFTLLECLPHTGRLHQIRLHLEYLGYPIVGDQIYGTDGSPFLRFRAEGMTPRLEEELGHWRQALHAHWIEIPHPRTRINTRFEAPLAADLVELVEKLGDVEDLRS